MYIIYTYIYMYNVYNLYIYICIHIDRHPDSASDSGDELSGALGSQQLLPARPACSRCLAWHLSPPPAGAPGAAAAHAAEVPGDSWGLGSYTSHLDPYGLVIAPIYGDLM